MRVEVKIEPKTMAEFMAAMTEYGYACRETLRDIGLKNAALMCRESIMLTPPLAKGGKGLTDGSRKAGENAISTDVRKLFIPVDKRGGIAPLILLTQNLAYSARFGSPAEFRALLDGAARTVLKRGTKVVQAIANDYDDERAFRKAKNYFNRTPISIRTEYGTGYTTDLRTFHQQKLNQFGGRFKKAKQPVSPLENWRHKRLVQDDATIKAYIASRAPAVGRLKSGWYQVLMTLPKPSSRENKSNFGTSGIPSYVKTHAGNTGYQNVVDAAQVFEITLGNRIADLNNVSTEADVKSTVLGLRYKQLRLDLEQRLKKAADKFNRK